MKNWKLWVFPILTTIFYYLSLAMVSKNQKAQPKMKDADGNEIEMPDMRTMNITMPLLSGWISASVPQGMGLYWFSNSLLQIIIQLITEKFISKDTVNDDKVLKPVEAVKEDEPISKSKQKKIEKNKKKK